MCLCGCCSVCLVVSFAVSYFSVLLSYVTAMLMTTIIFHDGNMIDDTLELCDDNSIDNINQNNNNDNDVE